MTKQEIIDKIKTVQSEEELAQLLVDLSLQNIQELSERGHKISALALSLAIAFAPLFIDMNKAEDMANKKLEQLASQSEKQRAEEAINKYSKIYKIDKRVLEKVLHRETSYLSHSDVTYRASIVGDKRDKKMGPSYGAAQVKVPTARWIYKKFPEKDINPQDIKASLLQHNIDFNIRTAAKILGFYYNQVFSDVKNLSDRIALTAYAYNAGLNKAVTAYRQNKVLNKYASTVSQYATKDKNMNESKSLFKEYLYASEYVNYNDIYSKAEVPIKTQLQQLLANLPDEQQLSTFEGDIRTLKVSMNAMKFESPSMKNSVKQIEQNVLTVRDSLRKVVSTIEQLLRDLSLQNPSSGTISDLEGGTRESGADYNAKLRREGKEWAGLSAKYDPAELVKKFGYKTVNKGVKVVGGKK